ncbi:uncharacterized protein FOMMEDRAFT_154132 [Fomitiporia mediterranea MF3/22]|uniref:uncharacterized protein n=1 Tax=Fomitiporia mediterranea (strain MF3/22) TaxID=694068 RepID=UPI000440882D|nr:uncharacterized protein FOMMEDRAFT_154132 [Fomitiporia mediterranea MF3/22]EJD04979.1 hypothetical protein FOMMEDRAFT_154132 [Fomitiporia mediterranea MF3/22]
MSFGFKGFHLVRVVIEDQVIYYGFVILCCVLNIVEISVIFVNEFSAAVLAAAGSPILVCVLGAHLLINLKEAGELGVNEGTNYRSRTVSDIRFAEGAPAAATSNGDGTSSV